MTELKRMREGMGADHNDSVNKENQFCKVCSVFGLLAKN